MRKRIYIAHPTSVDYQKEIYDPLRSDELFDEYDLILPHEQSNKVTNVRQDYRNIDLMIAEVSTASLGVGIEMGWCYDEKKPIYCLYKTEKKPSMAVYAIANEVIKYEDAADFVEKVKRIISGS